MEEEKITTPASEETETQVISPEESTVAEDVVSEDANTGKKEKKPKNKLLPLWIVLGIIAGIAVIVAIIAIANAGCKASMMKYVDTFGPTEKANKLVPTIEDGYYTFTTNEDFKVMQLTDIHIGGGFGSFSRDKKALNAVDAMIKAEKPDFIVVTGDMAFPVPYSSVTFNNMTGLTEFFTFMENQQIYWTLTFGNHDTEAYSYYNREEISDFVEDQNFKYCLYSAGPEDVDGYGNHVVRVKDTNGLITQAFIMLDSHAYKDSDVFGVKWEYDNMKPSQEKWYKEEVAKLNAENSAKLATLSDSQLLNPRDTYTNVKTMMFFHIPLGEVKTCVEAYVESGFSKNPTADIEFVDGIIGEEDYFVGCGVGDDNMFETILEVGSTQAIFNGHDHVNNSIINYKGVNFVYGMSIDYLAYLGIDKVGVQRGCTIIMVSNDGSIDITLENYYQDKYESKYEKEEVEDMDEIAKRW